MGFPEKLETVVIRNAGRKCAFERLKLQGSELHESAWFVFSGHSRAFGGILLSSVSIHLSPSILVFTSLVCHSADKKHSYFSPSPTWEDEDL